MTRGFSVWLDVLRIVATLAVVVSHLAYPRFTNGDLQFLRDWNLGSDAVIVFFVISGLVIAYAAERDGNGRTFAFNRMTRLWSVILRALLLTYAFDMTGYGIRAESYPAAFFHPHPFQDFMLRGLTFSNEFTLFGSMRLGTNGPLWSLSYEAAYYALFGAAMFLSGATRIVVLLALAVIAGPNILLLMPAWLMGVWVWRHIRAGGFQPASTAVAWVCAIAGPALYGAAVITGLPDTLGGMTATALGVADARHAIGFSDEFICNAMIGGLTVLHLYGMASLLKGFQNKAAVVRWAAGASFSIYVTHYPALHLLDAALPPDSAGRYLMLLIGALAVGFVFASLFERRLGAVRAAFRRLTPRGSRAA